jgi:uncharacterized protein YyaL (SSP411 family)
MPFMVSNIIPWNTPAAQVVLAGRPDDEDFRALDRAVARHYMPSTIVIRLNTAGRDAALTARVPWLAAMDAVNGRAAAYVCRDFTCQAPVTGAEALDRALAELATPRRIVG